MFRALRYGVPLLVGLAVLEILLQIVAYNVWVGQRADEVRAVGDGPVVLCVGDSMSHGYGAVSKDGAYPRQLQKILRERDGRPWVVVNGAWPGRDSRAVLELLPDQIRRFRPDYVCILAGINDRWTDAERMTAAEFDDSFPLVWRTGRFLDLMLVGRLDRFEELPFLGVWNTDNVEFRFDADGGLLFEGKEVTWSLRGDRIHVSGVAARDVEVDWKMVDGKLHLASSEWNRDLLLSRGPAVKPSDLELGQRALAADDLPAAKARFLAVTTNPQASISEQALAREGLVTVCQQQQQVTDQSLAWLRRESARSESIDRDVGESLAYSQVVVGEVITGVRTAIRIVEEHPTSLRAWSLLAAHETEANPRPVVLGLIDQALRTLPERDEFRGTLLIQRSLLVRQDDPAQFLRDLLRAVLVGRDASFVRNLLHLNRSLLTPAVRENVLAGMQPGAHERTRLEALVAASFAEDAGWRSVLADHLNLVVATCQSAGATPLLLDYPFREPDHVRLVETIAASKRVRRVRIRPRFEQLLQSLDRAELFVPGDMHCNDGGYRVMAEVVADSLTR